MDLLLTGLLMHPVALIVILIIALLIFGKNLPEVARSLGKGIGEFKRGVRGIEEEIDQPLPLPQYRQIQHDQQYGAPPQPPAYHQPEDKPV